MTPEEAARVQGLYKQADEDLLRAYKLAFGSPAGQAVLMDLLPFCRALESCLVGLKSGEIDRDRMLMMEGRREVFLRIQKFLNLSYEQLFSIRTGVALLKGADE